MKTVELSLHQVGLSCVHSRLETADHIAHELVTRLVATFASENQDPYIYETYSSWFQHLKDQVFPKWLKKHFPVKRTKHEITLKLVYPKLKAALPRNLMGPTVHITVMNEPMWNFDPSTEGETPIEFDSRLEQKLMSEGRNDYDTCPFCRRAIFSH